MSEAASVRSDTQPSAITALGSGRRGAAGVVERRGAAGVVTAKSCASGGRARRAGGWEGRYAFAPAGRRPHLVGAQGLRYSWEARRALPDVGLAHQPREPGPSTPVTTGR